MRGGAGGCRWRGRDTAGAGGGGVCPEERLPDWWGARRFCLPAHLGAPGCRGGGGRGPGWGRDALRAVRLELANGLPPAGGSAECSLGARERSNGRRRASRSPRGRGARRWLTGGRGGCPGGRAGGGGAWRAGIAEERGAPGSSRKLEGVSLWAAEGPLASNPLPRLAGRCRALAGWLARGGGGGERGAPGKVAALRPVPARPGGAGGVAAPRRAPGKAGQAGLPGGGRTRLAVPPLGARGGGRPCAGRAGIGAPRGARPEGEGRNLAAFENSLVRSDSRPAPPRLTYRTLPRSLPASQPNRRPGGWQALPPPSGSGP